MATVEWGSLETITASGESGGSMIAAEYPFDLDGNLPNQVMDRTGVLVGEPQTPTTPVGTATPILEWEGVAGNGQPCVVRLWEGAP